MRLSCLVAATLLAGCSAASIAAPAPVATTNATSTPAPVGMGAPKIPLRGLIDMQDIHWHDVGAQPAFDMSNVQLFPGLFGGIVINATWSQMQPVQGGAVDFSATDAALNMVRSYNAGNSSAPLGVKLRVYAGSEAPSWAKQIGGPITVYRNPAGCGGLTDTCAMTEGAFWTQTYIAAWRAFQAQVAAKYDADPLVIAVAVTSCASQTDEPFVPSSGPVSKANLGAAGYNDANEQSCLSGAVADYAAWQQTDIDFTFNTYSKFTGGLDESFTKTVMTACRTTLSLRCVLDNHALQAPIAASESAVTADITAMGQPIDFQTQAPEAMGCIWPETVTQGIASGARAIELWPEAKYEGFDTLSVPQVGALRALFYNPLPASTPAPSPMPTPCSGYN